LTPGNWPSDIWTFNPPEGRSPLASFDDFANYPIHFAHGGLQIRRWAAGLQIQREQFMIYRGSMISRAIP